MYGIIDFNLKKMGKKGFLSEIDWFVFKDSLIYVVHFQFLSNLIRLHYLNYFQNLL